MFDREGNFLRQPNFFYSSAFHTLFDFSQFNDIVLYSMKELTTV